MAIAGIGLTDSFAHVVALMGPVLHQRPVFILAKGNPALSFTLTEFQEAVDSRNNSRIWLTFCKQH